MSGIAIMTIFTFLITLLFFLLYLRFIAHGLRRFAWVILVGLPLPFIVNPLVKEPLIRWLGQTANITTGLGAATPFWFLLFLLLLSPVVEEAIKALPVLIPPLRRFLGTKMDSLWAGLALGFGFGLGEILYLAWTINNLPLYTSYPWYAFIGFFTERLLTTFAHGMMTAIVVSGLQRGGKKALFGYLGGVGLHTLINLGAFLFQLGKVDGSVAEGGLALGLAVGLVTIGRLRRNAAIEQKRNETATLD